MSTQPTQHICYLSLCNQLLIVEGNMFTDLTMLTLKRANWASLK